MAKKIKQLLVIEGPTASGKTALSVQLARHFSTAVVSADSRQFYKEMSIGTAKPEPEEMEDIPHYFIDSHSIHDELTAARYAEEAMDVLDTLFAENECVILTGGSGMFIDALCIGLDPIPTSDTVKDAVIQAHARHGLEPLLEELKAGDPAYYAEVDKQNPARIIRAVEVLRLTGRPYSAQRANAQAARPFESLRFVINHPREALYARINQRVESMMNKGLLDEVRALQPHKSLRALQTVGYTELFAHLEGQCALEEAVDRIKQNTRRYAKRQLTWFRRHPEAHWLQHTDTAGMLEEILGIHSIRLKSRAS